MAIFAATHSRRLFEAARARFASRTSLWERMRKFFTGFRIPDWTTLRETIAKPTLGPELKLNSS